MPAVRTLPLRTVLLWAALAAIVAAFMIPAAVRADTGLRENITLRDLQIPDTTVRGLNPISDFFFPSSGDVPILSATLELDLSHSEVLVNPSSLVVSMNQVPLRTIRLDRTNAGRQVLRIDVPRELLVPTFNRLTLEYLLVLPDDVCGDYDDPARFATIFTGTGIRYAFGTGATTTYIPNLTAWPSPYMRPNYPVTSDPIFVIPDNPNGAELSSAASLIGHLQRVSRGTTFTPLLRTASTATQAELSDRNLITIGHPSRNPISAQVMQRAPVTAAPDGTLRTAVGATIPAADGVVLEAASPFRANRAALVVASESEEGIRYATVALANLKSAALVSGEYTIVSDVSLRIGLGQEDASQTTTQTPFQQEQVVRGFGSQVVTVPFFAPVLGNDGIAVLEANFTHSVAMDAERTNVVVEVNGVPITTVNLNNGNGVVGTRVVLPQTSFNAGRNSLTFRFNIYGLIRGCGPQASERGWAVIQPTTRITFSGGTLNPSADLKPDLNAWPFPFVTLGSPENAILLVENGPGAFQTIPAIARQIGIVTLTDGLWLNTRTEAQLTDADRRNGNIIAVLPASSNFVQQDLAPSLPLQLEPDGTLRLSQGTGGQIFDVTRRGTFGILQVIVSPFTPNRWLLLASGSDETGIINAAAALARPLPPGNVATVDAAGRVTSLTTAGFTAVEQATPASRVVLLASIAVGVLTVLLVALILYRWTRGEYSIRARDPDSF